MMTTFIPSKKVTFTDGTVVTCQAMSFNKCGKKQPYTIAYIDENGKNSFTGCNTVLDFTDFCIKHNTHAVLFKYHRNKEEFEIVKKN